MKSSSPTLCYPLSTSPLPYIGENLVDENVPEHVQIGMSYEDYAMMVSPLIYNPFLDQIVHFQRELSLPDCSFWLKTVKLRGAEEEPGEVVLVNHIPTLWIDKSVPLIPDNLPYPTLQITSCLTHLVLIESVYNGLDIIMKAQAWHSPCNLIIRLCRFQFITKALRSSSAIPPPLTRVSLTSGMLLSLMT